MLVIFDCDGVLVDTESITNRRLAEMISQAGLPISVETCKRRFCGMTVKLIREVLLTENGIDMGADFPQRWNDELPLLFANGVEAIPHVADVIDILDRAAIPLCVASSARVEKMHMTLGMTGLLKRLEPVLFSASMVERGKPFPDLFLHAAAKMGHAPQDCVVIEDSVAGVTAGTAAGMRVLAYGGDIAADHGGLLAAGGELFGDMRDVPRMIGLFTPD